MTIKINGEEKRIGLALSGGGFRAAGFHLGVMRELHVGEGRAGVEEDGPVLAGDGRVARRRGAAQLVVAAVREERADLEAHRPGGLREELPPDDGRLLAVDEEEGLP